MLVSGTPANKVTSRIELIHLLTQAAELEHSAACQYLFAAFSLKQPGDENITPKQLRMVKGWYDTLMGIAVEEMLHLTQVCNLLTAIGGAPVLRRGRFPQRAKRFSLGLVGTLSAFSDESIHRYICWEKPSEIEDEWCDRLGVRVREGEAADPYDKHLEHTEALLIPASRPFHSIDTLYGLIDSGFAAIPAQQLFIGPPAAQITNDLIPFRKCLLAIRTPEDAHRAIHLIVVEGEGSPRDRDESHYARFKALREALSQERQRDHSFKPARPVIDNPVFSFARDVENVVPGAHVITDPWARRVGEVFTATYDLMLQILMRFFGHTEESEDQLRILLNAAMSMMTGAIRPLGIMLTGLPAGVEYPRKKAGPSFEIYRDVQPLPHMSSAWTYFRERLTQIANECLNLSVTPNAPDGLDDVSAVLQFWVEKFT